MVENQNHNEKMMHQNTSLDQEVIQVVDIVNLSMSKNQTLMNKK